MLEALELEYRRWAALLQNKNLSIPERFCISLMAGPTGFEPAISSVTGRRDRPLHYEPLPLRIKSNRGKFIKEVV
jgi:hypothetical protein